MAEQRRTFSFINFSTKVAPSSLEPPTEIIMQTARTIGNSVLCDKGRVIETDQLDAEAKPVGGSGNGSGKCDGVGVGCSCGCDCTIV